MRNLFIQVEQPFATWIADLAAVVASPERVLDVVVAVLEAGERHEVFVPVTAPLIGYERARDGDLGARLRRTFTDMLTVDAFAFTGAAMLPDHASSSHVTAKLAMYDTDDRLVERVVADLSVPLRESEPVTGSLGEGFTRPFPPVRITGPKLVYMPARDGYALASPARSTAIRIALHSDLWFPFVFGSAHPLADHQRMFDNRALASRHTPRLNAFLQDVSRAVVSAGGRFSVDDDETGGNARNWLDEQGIHLDAPAPVLMPPEALDAEWY